MLGASERVSMSPEAEASQLSARIDDVTGRFDEFEAELDDAIGSGRDRIRELTAALRTRIDALRGEVPEPEPTRVEALREDLEELSDAVESEFDEGRHRLAELLADLREDVRELERTVRRS